MSEDVEDYLKHKLLSEQGIPLGRLKIKNGVYPHVFACQQKQKAVGDRPNIYKRKKIVEDAMVASSAEVEMQQHDYGTSYQITRYWKTILTCLNF